MEITASQASAVPRAAPVEVFQGDLRRVCGAFHLEPADRAGMVRGAVGTRTLGRFDTALVTLDVAHAERGPRDIRHDPGEHLFLLVQCAGSAEIRQGGQPIRLHPGDMAVVDAASPLHFNFGGQLSQQISLHLPRDEMVRRFGPACTGGAAFLRTDPLWRPMNAVIARMMDAPPAEALGLSEALLGLFAAGFAARGGGDRADPLISRAMALMEQRADDPAFGPGVLADLLGVSGRVLQRHFRQIGDTPGRRLMHLRLDRAHRRLTERARGLPRGGIAGVAFSSGFNDLSHFYREYGRRFGTTPGGTARALSHSPNTCDG